MPYSMVNDVKHHYWQTGQGPNLTMLHGFGGNLAVWHFAIAPKLRQDFRITTYDLKGHGRSDVPPSGYTTRDMAHDLAKLLDNLEIEKTDLLGHSFGADISLHFALLYPERVKRLIVVDAMLPLMLEKYMDPDWPGWKYWAEMLQDVAGVEVPKEQWQDVRHMLGHSLQIPVIFGPFRGREREAAPITGLLTETSVVQDYYEPHEMTRENLKKIKAETLLIFDESSPFLETHDVLAAEIPNVESALLPESELRHFSPLEQPEFIVEHTKEFLGRERASEAVAEEALNE